MGSAARALIVLLLTLGGIFLIAGEALAAARPGGGGAFTGGSNGTTSPPSKPSQPQTSESKSSSKSSTSTKTSTSRSSDSDATSRSTTSSGGGSNTIGGLAFVVLVAVIVGWGLISKKREARSSPLRSQHAVTPTAPVAPRSVRRELLGLRTSDPSFSLALFDDFLVALYVELKVAHGGGQLARYQPYLSARASTELGQAKGAITNVIVGSTSIEEVGGLESTASHVRVRVGFETNYTVRGPGGESALYAHEEWTLTRRRDAKSRPPEAARVLGCPSCGAPLDVIAAGVCSHCQVNVTGGSFDWIVDSIKVLGTEPRGPMLTGSVEEVGTDGPTVVAEDAQQLFRAIEAADPATTWDALSARVGLIFNEFQAAWSARDLAKMRPYMSDALFATQTFWVEEYKRQKLRNVTEGAAISSQELASVTQDAFFDAVTVRVHASSLDYTVRDSSEELVSGSRTTPRRYSEYWTLLRGRNAKGAPKLERACPNCGAPLDLTMVGVCNYCKVKVTSGDFDWVLSRIEQDEVYRG